MQGRKQKFSSLALQWPLDCKVLQCLYGVHCLGGPEPSASKMIDLFQLLPATYNALSYRCMGQNFATLPEPAATTTTTI